MYDGFEEFRVAVSPDVTIYGRKAGSGTPLLLLHGYPENHRIWHLVAPQLVSSFTVVIPDLRGYGQSSAPPGDASHAVYSKRSMANDMLALMLQFGFPKFNVCGHDRGGRVAHRLAVDHPDAVIRIMVLDIAPTLAMYEATDFHFASAYWHWFFLIQEYPLPETFITAKPEALLLRVTSRGGFQFHPEAIKSYEEGLRDWNHCHAMCEDYRASASIDLEQAREDVQAGRKVQCPLSCLWGKRGLTNIVAKPAELWQDVCAKPISGTEVDSGHYIPEEAPKLTVEHIHTFFV